jgi:alginate O-acetyltransferase complex protein AlgI
MQFTTLQFFLFFLGVFLAAMLLKGNRKFYPMFLLLASASFYLFFGVNFTIILALNIVCNYFLLKAVDKLGKKALVISVVLNVAFLAAFKYYNFGIDSFLQVLNLLNMPADIQVLRILIPVGISFYTFRNISHLVDCYRKELPVPSFVDYANYVAFFPQIMSGPIVRAKEFYPYLHDPYRFEFSQGRIITLILSGLLKKYVIASYLYDFASSPFVTPANYSSLDLIISALAYTMMIFVDFSGYSDFAIAISNLLGFDVKPNFHSPYRSIGLKDFWNRWHISLSTWLKDYLYIPLGGSRKGTARKYINIILTMFISGLWHGAGLTFVVWGLLHGIGSVISHIIADFFNRSKKIETPPFAAQSNQNFEIDDKEIERLVENIEPRAADKTIGSMLLNFVGWLVTFVYVSFAWIFFTAPSIGNALAFIGGMFVSTVAEHKFLNLRLLLVIAVVLLFNFIGDRAFRGSINLFDKMPLAVRVPVVAVVAYLILQLGPETVPPFIYFNF